MTNAIQAAPVPSQTGATQRVTFFRQSGWLMLAALLGGGLTYAVHFLNNAPSVRTSGEYGLFGVLLAVVTLVPTLPLQMVLAQQTAKALTEGREQELAYLLRSIWLGLTLVWLVIALVALLLQRSLLARLETGNPAGLWMTLLALLLTLWTPLFAGALQGMQNFLWLGWSTLGNALGRITVAAAAVVLLHAGHEGLMAGVLAGAIGAGSITVWQSRQLWRCPPRRAPWSPILRQIVPVALAFLGLQILLTADTIFVGFGGRFEKSDKDAYVAAGTMARALMWLVLPLATVMFPRLVQSAAKSQKSDLPRLVLLGTLVLGLVGVLGLWMFGPWIVKLAYMNRPAAMTARVLALLPSYSVAMVPLALGNVLLNDLFAKPSSRLLPALGVFLLSLVYLFALTQCPGPLERVLQILGMSCALLFAFCAWLTWGRSAR